jgi:hypothetical protein
MMKFRHCLSVLLLAPVLALGQGTSARTADAGSTNVVQLTNLTQLARLLQLTNLATHLPPDEPAPVTETTGIYATRPVPPLADLLRPLAPTAICSETNQGGMIKYTCAWPEVAVRFTVAPHWDGPGQRGEMKKWIFKFPPEATNTPAVGTLLRQMDATVACVGVVVTPHYDAGGRAAALVLGLAEKLEGYEFYDQSFYDAAGARIIGATNAPVNLEKTH